MTRETTLPDDLKNKPLSLRNMDPETAKALEEAAKALHSIQKELQDMATQGLLGPGGLEKVNRLSDTNLRAIKKAMELSVKESAEIPPKAMAANTASNIGHNLVMPGSMPLHGLTAAIGGGLVGLAVETKLQTLVDEKLGETVMSILDSTNPTFSPITPRSATPPQKEPKR